jgi:hypothetical protein
MDCKVAIILFLSQRKKGTRRSLAAALSTVEFEPQYIGVHTAPGLETQGNVAFLSAGSGEFVAHVLHQELYDGVGFQRLQIQQLQEVPDTVHQFGQDPPAIKDKSRNLLAV